MEAELTIEVFSVSIETGGIVLVSQWLLERLRVRNNDENEVYAQIR